jgi:hypothetical protein
LQGLLEIDIGFSAMMMPAQDQVLPAKIADNAAPQGFIQIKDDELAGKSEHSAKSSFDIPDGGLEDVIIKYDFSQIP